MGPSINFMISHMLVDPSCSSGMVFEVGRPANAHCPATRLFVGVGGLKSLWILFPNWSVEVKFGMGRKVISLRPASSNLGTSGGTPRFGLSTPHAQLVHLSGNILDG